MFTSPCPAQLPLMVPAHCVNDMRRRESSKVARKGEMTECMRFQSANTSVNIYDILATKMQGLAPEKAGFPSVQLYTATS